MAHSVHFPGERCRSTGYGWRDVAPSTKSEEDEERQRMVSGAFPSIYLKYLE